MNIASIAKRIADHSRSSVVDQVVGMYRHQTGCNDQTALFDARQAIEQDLFKIQVESSRQKHARLARNKSRIKK